MALLDALDVGLYDVRTLEVLEGGQRAAGRRAGGQAGRRVGRLADREKGRQLK